MARLNAGVRFYIHYTRGVSAAYSHAESKGIDAHAYVGRLHDCVARLTGCIQTCDAHQAWAEFEPKVSDTETLAKRINETREKIGRILARYTGGVVTSVD
jgi:hypothetical protein